MQAAEVFEAPNMLNVPARQLMHPSWPRVSWYRPFAQELQSALPVAGWYWP